jgi:hypothetical protein
MPSIERERMCEIPKNLGERIVEAASVAMLMHLGALKLVDCSTGEVDKKRQQPIAQREAA